MFLSVVRWAMPSAASLFFVIRTPVAFPDRRILLCALPLLSALLSPAQWTTGLVEGTVHQRDRPVASPAAFCLEGGVGFKARINTDSVGHFALALPYGRYRFSGNCSQLEVGFVLVIAPLQTHSVDFVLSSSGELHDASRRPTASFGLWSDTTRTSSFPEGFSLQSVLASREPSSVTVPLNFTGLADNRLALVSIRAYSWTGTQFRWQGLDGTDSYQPGRSALLPDVQALGELVVRTGPALLTAESYGAEVGAFLIEPEASWHGDISTFETGSALSSNNLLPAAQRGALQQSEHFAWFTRDHLEAGGPVTSRADLFAATAGQWASQTMSTAVPGGDQNSRLLWANVRGRLRAGAHDQLEADYSGSHVNLSRGGVPAGLEALVSRRQSPEFNQPDGFLGEAEGDRLTSVQLGWTRSLPAAAGFGTLQVRYGYSAAHFDTWPSALTTPNQSRVELLGSAVTGAPPLATLAARPRHEIAAAWQPALPAVSNVRQQITVGGDGKISLPRNRFTTPAQRNLVTAGGVPAYVVSYNTPAESRERVHTVSAFAADHLVLREGLSADIGVWTDLSRGSSPTGKGISWNSLSPRAGFAWRVPHTHGFLVQASYRRSYSPLAARYLDYGNSNSLGGSIYQWTDRNGNGWFEPGEEGALLMRFGGPYSSLAPSLRRPYADEWNVGGQWFFSHHAFTRVQLFRRDEKNRLAAVDTGLGANAFTPMSIPDPGPDGLPGTFDDQRLTVYQQNPATLGQDHYVLTNPPRLQMLHAGFVAEVGGEWRGLLAQASFTAEKSWGPTNPGNAVFENDPGVIGALFADPNSAARTLARSYVDRAYLGKLQASYRLPAGWGGWQLAGIANYLDGLPFARQLLVTGFPQGPLLTPTTVRGSPEGGNRAQYVLNWNLRVQKESQLPVGRITALVDILNVMNARQAIQQVDLSGPTFNARLPLAIQPARAVRLGLAYHF
jgi:hypothetical protein